MGVYTPYRWVLVAIDTSEGPLFKVLAGWPGDYLHGDSWKLSSGVTKITEDETSYYIDNYSGSQYICLKEHEGLSVLTNDIFHQLLKTAGDRNPRVVTVGEVNDSLTR